ncbi:unnamed protein product [Adineta steineri]|uniref:Amine oxidase domain-containing protein n=1 Tax=Adineta steineri TaxID=433720 RepID=A0A814R2X0_9BILA|nr:unnamed protein product [Adineta steineri]CAF4171529.1 unnamed protein product [Adineta steineri]
MDKHYCVVIIGAGIAGLSCAKYLIENDIHDFIIIEANNQIGGRCETIPLMEHQIELGTEILQGDQSNNPLYQLADEHHLIDYSNNEFDRDDCFHDEDGESIDEDIINEIRTIYDEILKKKVPTYPYENYPDSSLGEFISTELDQYVQSKKVSLEKNEIDQIEKVIDWLSKQHSYLNTIGCEKLTDVSVQGWNSFEHISKPDQSNDVIKYIQGGFSNFLHIVFGNKIPNDNIELNSMVKRICMYEDDQYVSIEIIGKNKEMKTYQAEHVICTQSVGCLKKTMHDMFVPPLPYSKQLCIEKLGFGTINKIYLIFSHAFWDVDFNTFNFLWNTTTEWKLTCLENTSYDSQWCKSITGFYVHHRLPNILVTQIGGEAATYIETIPDEILTNCFQELFGRFYPDNQIPKPKKLIRSQWFNKTSTHGSHTFIKTGSNTHDIKRLAMPWPNQPAKPLILFAGEGTHERFYGTAHGAFMTGIREAKRIVELYKKDFINQ